MNLSIAMIDQSDFKPSISKSFHSRVSAITPASKEFLESINVWNKIKRKNGFEATKVWDQNSHGHLNFHAKDEGIKYLGYIVENDLPSGWQRDDRSYKKRTEPEECSLVEKDDKLYAVFALQESHAVIVYDVTDPANPVFDSMAPAGIDYANDNGMEKSAIGSEGLGMHQTNGVAFSANEREGSISMFTAAWARE